MLKVLFIGHEKEFADYEELKAYKEANPNEIIQGITYLANEEE